MLRVTVFALLFFIGCADEKNEAPNSNTDVVSNQAPKYSTSFWNISTDPILAIGTENGEPTYHFHRSYSAKKLDNGNLVVSNSGTSEIRWYDSEGNFIKSVGQNGRGPGDFAEFSSMRIHKYLDGSLIVTDGGNDRFQVFTVSGELLEVISFPQFKEYGNPNIRGTFGDGSWLIWTHVVKTGTENPGELIEQNYALHRMKSDQSKTDLLIQYPSRKRFVHEFNGVTRRPYVPLEPETSYSTNSKNDLLIAEGLDPEIKKIDSLGIVKQIYKWKLPRISTSEIWEKYQEDYLNSVRNDDFERYKDFLSKPLPIPEQIPAISDLKIDTENNIWAKRFIVPEDKATWDILNSDGVWLGTISTPDGMVVTEIGSDYILGYTSSNGFRQIVMHSLNKSAATK